jgi:hypothetical protein
MQYYLKCFFQNKVQDNVLNFKQKSTIILTSYKLNI